MRFLVRLSKGTDVSPADRSQLGREAYEAVRKFGADVGNLRISSSAVELDLLLDSETELQNAVAALEHKFGSLLTIRKLDVESLPIEDAEAIKMGLELFNQERYWESHEALEYAWRRSSGSEKCVLQGIILLAAALVHLQKNERDVAFSIMQRAHSKIFDYEGGFFGFDITALKKNVQRMLSSGRVDFFRIETRQ